MGIMPHLDVSILRAWRITDKTHPTRIHYVLGLPGGKERRLYADPGSGLYDVLDRELLDQDYVLPASGRPPAISALVDREEA